MIPTTLSLSPGGDGIRVLSPDTFLSGNITNNFAGYGIHAVEGVKSGVELRPTAMATRRSAST